MKQTQALFVMKRGDSVFLTGPAGSGKTYVLNQFIEWAKSRKKQVAVTASTGVAATHIGGTTVHSWSGLGIRDELTASDRTWLKGNSRLSKRYNQTDILIIDEASMLHGKRLDMVNEVCKLLRASDEPFGGLQVILTGDLFQLPPVNRGGGKDDFVHLSAAWQELKPKICYLSEQHRQNNGDLLAILSAMRTGDITEEHQNILADRVGLEPDSSHAMTRLYAHNVDVGVINDNRLGTLDGKSYMFPRGSSGAKAKIEQLTRGMLTPEVLELKVGAEVMFVVNQFDKGIYNGSRGVVVDFDDGTPMIKLQNRGRVVKAEPHSWTLEEDGKVRARVVQVPLRLAWAITIHKSQGMSLDSAEIDLSRSFTYGMGYVALSRVRNIDGLYLKGLNAMAMRLHPAIHEFDEQLQSESGSLAELIGEVLEEEESLEEAIAEEIPNPQLLDKLKAWRTQESSAQDVPAFIIAHNKTLEAITLAAPKDKRELLAVKGVGQKFIDAYGEAVLSQVESIVK